MLIILFSRTSINDIWHYDIVMVQAKQQSCSCCIVSLEYATGYCKILEILKLESDPWHVIIMINTQKYLEGIMSWFWIDSTVPDEGLALLAPRTSAAAVVTKLRSYICIGHGGRFKNACELLNLRSLKIWSFNVWVRYFMWNLKGTLSNSTQNILPTHWKMVILITGENLQAHRFKSS